MTSASDTITLFADSPPAKSSTSNPVVPPEPASPHLNSSTNSSTTSIGLNEQLLNIANSPKIPDSSGMKFSINCVFDARKPSSRVFKHDFRGIPWTIIFYKKSNSLGCKICCNQDNESRLWGCTAAICRTMILPASYPGQDNYQDFEFDADNVSYDFPSLGHWTCLMDFKFDIHVKRVVGIPLKHVIDFTQPKEHIFDGVFVVEGKKAYVGKSFLAMFSPYFSALFFSGFSESNLPEVKITDEDIKYDDFIEFLSFIYPNEKIISQRNVDTLLKYSDRFDVACLTEKCERWLKEHCGGISDAHKLLLAEKYRLSSLQNHILTGLKTQRQVKELSKSLYYGELSDASKTAILNQMLEIMDTSSESTEEDSDELEEEKDDDLDEDMSDSSESDNDLIEDIVEMPHDIERRVRAMAEKNESMDDVIVVD